MLIYLDTNIWIYAVEDHPTFGALARQMFVEARAKGHRVAGSLFVLGELLVLSRHDANEFAAAAYRSLFQARQVVLLPYSASAMETYVALRAYQRLKPMDALHLATAAHAGADMFLTEDVQLLSKKVPDAMTIVNLSTALAML